jgi:dTDP-4-amino-4,6-dideoxygalactose transaminase
MKDLEIQNEYKWVTKFEKRIAKFCNSPYAVAVDCGTNALFLSLVFQSYYTNIKIPKRTYIGVYSAILNSGKKVTFEDTSWVGMYSLKPTNIFDCACFFEENMFVPGTVMCLSFSYKKKLPIGRAGAILTDNHIFYDWCIKARNLGKDITKDLNHQEYSFIGWNMLLHPDLAKKGYELMKTPPKASESLPTSEDYPDLQSQLSPHLGPI